MRRRHHRFPEIAPTATFPPRPTAGERRLAAIEGAQRKQRPRLRDNQHNHQEVPMTDDLVAIAVIAVRHLSTSDS